MDRGGPCTQSLVLFAAFAMGKVCAQRVTALAERSGNSLSRALERDRSGSIFGTDLVRFGPMWSRLDQCGPLAPECVSFVSIALGMVCAQRGDYQGERFGERSLELALLSRAGSPSAALALLPLC